MNSLPQVSNRLLTIGLLALGLMLISATEAIATGADIQTSRSVGKLQLDQSIDLTQLLSQGKPLGRVEPNSKARNVAPIEALPLVGVANRHDQSFEVFEADLQTLADFDQDGYHHALQTVFDVDVSYGDATVYAKLYLSRDGGDWYHHYTTDLFSIRGDDTADTYAVQTELLSGYPPGYYDLLIEIYSLDHADLVTSELLNYAYLGRGVRLEDITYDDPYSAETYYELEYIEHSHGASSAGGLLGLLFMIQVVIAARGFLALIPRKKRL